MHAHSLTGEKSFLAVQPVFPKQTTRHKIFRSNQLLPALFLFFSLLLQLVVRLEIVENGYLLESLRHQALQRDAKLRELQYELSSLTRPMMVEYRARHELEMKALSPQRIRRIKNLYVRDL